MLLAVAEMSNVERSMRALLLALERGKTERAVRTAGLKRGEVDAVPVSARVIGAEGYLSHLSAAPEKSND